jgi:hypothetical protein
MTWDDVGLGASNEFGLFGSGTPELPKGRDEMIELVGTHLRLNGHISLGRFLRLTDLINASSGYVRINQAQLLRRNGDPTNLILPELMVDQDEISFIAQREFLPLEEGSGQGFVDQGVGGAVANRQTREFVLFTPGHTVSGTVYIFGETDLAAFVDSSHPRFVPMIDVTTRSLADRRIISHYPFILINRTQMIAASEIGQHGNIETEEAHEL